MGFFCVEVFPSPKSQSQLLIFPSATIERSSNAVSTPLQAIAYTKSTSGTLRIVMDFVEVVLHPKTVLTVRLTVYVPGVSYVADGLTSLDTFPLPKSQEYPVM